MDRHRFEWEATMSNVTGPGRRLDAAIELREAALAVLRQMGEPSSSNGGAVVFQQPTELNPEPRLSLWLSKFPPDQRNTLSVWAPYKGGYAKVMNIEWLGDRVHVMSFRRGEWETELLAMGRAKEVAIH
jgi:hypothetical protein